MRARFLVLGPVSVTEGDEVVVPRPSKPTTLPAAMLLRPVSAVSAVCAFCAVCADFLARALRGARPSGPPPAGTGAEPGPSIRRLEQAILRRAELAPPTCGLAPPSVAGAATGGAGATAVPGGPSTAKACDPHHPAA
ncbi:hypothetical protein [Wenjunlia tyrosinilytica]|uniref:Uncharacterized protein n=1 Tax=Wenjunlia tyrosinilytica TaxID=1544741 RepID=A0A917ZSM0_9ACTN|nr:hypothetical protein [Wenjunlia tyrosinilytica]GGO89056.1 hypothetical protein GCM10012280_31310 [Wenjunlia tyrosinilytica]